MKVAVLVASWWLITSCSPPSDSSKSGAATRLPTTLVTLPSGKVIRAELALAAADRQRGLMYRTVLAPDEGMLFFFPEFGYYPFWMYHTLIPLDIIWMDANRSIVFISADTPPCRSEKVEDCRNYGGEQRAQYVLELAGGAAAKNGLKPGDKLRF
jgi:hypothetical protein